MFNNKPGIFIFGICVPYLSSLIAIGLTSSMLYGVSSTPLYVMEFLTNLHPIIKARIEREINSSIGIIVIGCIIAAAFLAFFLYQLIQYTAEEYNKFINAAPVCIMFILGSIAFSSLAVCSLKLWALGATNTNVTAIIISSPVALEELTLTKDALIAGIAITTLVGLVCAIYCIGKGLRIID